MIVGPDETSLVDSKTAYEALTTEAKSSIWVDLIHIHIVTAVVKTLRY